MKTDSQLLQAQMNGALKNKSYKKAYTCFTLMNEARVLEGLPLFTMPNLQARFEK